MKTLILIANDFPFGVNEPYLDTEQRFYSLGFDRIIIFSLLGKNELEKKRRINTGTAKIVKIKVPSKLKIFLHFFMKINYSDFLSEIRYLIKSHKLSIRSAKKLAVFMSLGSHLSKLIANIIKKNGIDDGSEVLIYSYRMYYQSYIAALLKNQFKHFKAIARGHGYDLYEERHSNHYIPMREYLLKNLDKVIMISQNGIDYLTGKYPNNIDRIALSRLGTIDYGVGPECPRSEYIRIVSCSSLVPVKRVDLIINALSKIKDKKIVWDHYGDGPLSEELKKLSKNSLNENVECRFNGHISNQELIQIYQNTPYHVFINVSSSEGVPVSIMEAMSFGIPIIATDAGGNREIVINGKSGNIIPVDFDENVLVEKIISIANMNDRDYRELRCSTRKIWKERSAAENLYPKFVKEISSIF